jgi:hypothetical protein
MEAMAFPSDMTMKYLDFAGWVEQNMNKPDFQRPHHQPQRQLYKLK